MSIKISMYGKKFSEIFRTIIKCIRITFQIYIDVLNLFFFFEKITIFSLILFYNKNSSFWFVFGQSFPNASCTSLMFRGNAGTNFLLALYNMFSLIHLRSLTSKCSLLSRKTLHKSFDGRSQGSSTAFRLAVAETNCLWRTRSLRFS
jgi:hypothetical protein